MTRERFEQTAYVGKISYETYQRCDCSVCKRENCIHRGAYRRILEEVGGLGLCPNLKEKMNGIDLLNNLIDELNRASDLLRLQLRDSKGITEVEELIEDIQLDLDRYHDVADSINACIEDIEV